MQRTVVRFQKTIFTCTLGFALRELRKFSMVCSNTPAMPGQVTDSRNTDTFFVFRGSTS
jgi:hypothetical protein